MPANVFETTVCLSCSLAMSEPIMWRPRCHSNHHAEVGLSRYIEAYAAESKKNMPRNVIGR